MIYGFLSVAYIERKRQKNVTFDILLGDYDGEARYSGAGGNGRLLIFGRGNGTTLT